MFESWWQWVWAGRLRWLDQWHVQRGYGELTFNDNIMIVISMELIIHMILIMIDGQNDDNDLTLWKGCEPQTSTEERRFRHVWEDGRWNPTLQGDKEDDWDEDNEEVDEDEDDCVNEDGHKRSLTKPQK